MNQATSREWRSVPLGDVAEMRSGGTPPSTDDASYGGGIPWVSISDMTAQGRFVRTTTRTLTKRGIDQSAAVIYPPNVVLYAMYASVGEVAMADGRVSSSQAILGIQPGPELVREYLYYYLSSVKEYVANLGQQGTQANLNAGMVRNLRVPLPSVEEQQAIAGVLSDADAEIDALQVRLEKTVQIRQGMMQELLTGRTRLPLTEAQESAA